MADSSQTRGVAYDPERLGEPGQPGVPMRDQRPTNEGDDTQNIAADVHIPGPYPSDRADPTAAPASEPEPTKASRGAASLGDVVHGMGSTVVDQEAARAGSGPARPSRQPETPQQEVEQLKEESHPGGAPEDSDLGTGRRKGQGLPPGSVDSGHDTPQTPAT